MKKSLISLLGTALALPLFAFGTPGNGRLETETRKLSAFSGIEMSGVGKLVVKRGSRHAVEILLDSNLLPLYKSEVRGGILHLGFAPGSSASAITRLEVTVTLAELEALALSGAASASLADDFAGKRLELELSGTGRLAGELDYRSLRASISGAGSLELEGEVDRLDLEISGSGSFKAEELAAHEASIEVSGTGQVVLRVEESLEVGLSGIGSVRYYGDPRVEKRLSGLGRVERIGR